ncbi:TRAFAC clade GTPase domain-containing protein [Pseudomonas coronafaciens]|uniref:TRAFAC clade GTPase domain-containing protein n=1 Tax=Pseudomonas coronafaciens TaxID=53409 RepID=UPI0011C342C2|nr:hypothetical protein [Pseudomonas coronafaciens]
MNKRSVVVIGLPSSGKTTFLAALWHLVTAKDVDTVLKFSSLPRGDVSHLNGIARRWREAKVQDRTAVSGHKLVTIKLESETDTIEVTFPDVPGESYRDMWENRFCDPEIAEILLDGNVILFIHADTIREPRWVVDEAELSRQLGLALPEGEIATWHPRLAPTQVQALDLLQLLRRPPLDIGSRRLVIMLSAWDKAKDEGFVVV